MKRHFIRNMATAAVTVLTLTGCAGTNLGQIGEILGATMGGAGGQQQQGNGRVLAEVQNVDTRQRVIQLRTQEGQTGNVMFDQNTVVVYQNQQHPVTALERGDVAYFQLQQTQQGATYAARIDVQQSVQERNGQQTGGMQGGGTYGGQQQMVQLAGTVGRIDYNQGWFELRTQNGTATVRLPYNAGDAQADYFRRLRTGQTVRVEGTNAGNGQVELYRFM
jgi:ribosomal protein L14